MSSGPYPDYRPKHRRRSNAGLLVGILVLGLSLMACAAGGMYAMAGGTIATTNAFEDNITALGLNATPKPGASHTPTGMVDVKVLDCKSDGQGVPYADLRVTNRGMQDASYFIVVSFLDAQGNQVNIGNGVIDFLAVSKSVTTKTIAVSITPTPFKTCKVVDSSKEY